MPFEVFKVTVSVFVPLAKLDVYSDEATSVPLAVDTLLTLGAGPEYEPTTSVTLTAAQSGVPAHGHGASGSYSGANFYIRHGSSSGTESVAAGTNTTITNQAYSSNWGNGFGVASYSHKPDRVNIGGTVSVTVNNNSAANASSGHSHGVSYIEVYVWQRTA